MVKYGCVSSRILWIKFKFSRVKVCVVVGYGPNEGDGKERDGVGNGYRMSILGDLNGWIGDRKRAGIIGAFGVPGESDNGRRLVELCEERGLCVGNTYFNHIRVYKYTRVARG